MSLFLFLEKEDEQKARVMCIHNFPNMLSEEEKRGGVLIDSYKNSVGIEGKIALPYYDYETKELYYEYIDKPKTENELLLDAIRLEMAKNNVGMFETMIAMQSEVIK